MTLLLITLAVGAAADEGPFDHQHGTFAKFLEGAVGVDSVDYGALAARRPLLDRYLGEIAAVDASGFSSSQKLALYVNAYNAWTLATVLDAGPPASILDLDGGKVWDTRRFRVAGEQLTLNEIEHGRARKLADGRVHAVVNCASRGCPPLPPTPLSPVDVDAQLDRAARRWASSNAFRLDGDTVALSKIFEWYADDFVADAKGDLPGVDGAAENALWFLSRFTDDPTREKLLSGTVRVSWAEYDWKLNRK